MGIAFEQSYRLERNRQTAFSYAWALVHLLRAAGETVKTVNVAFSVSGTPLKQGVNEILPGWLNSPCRKPFVRIWMRASHTAPESYRVPFRSLPGCPKPVPHRIIQCENDDI